MRRTPGAGSGLHNYHSSGLIFRIELWYHTPQSYLVKVLHLGGPAVINTRGPLQLAFMACKVQEKQFL